MKAKIAGMRASTVAAVNFVALLHPSWPHVSQNSVLIYDGVVVLMQLSAGALMSSQEQDREMTILSLTVERFRLLDFTIVIGVKEVFMDLSDFSLIND